MIRRNLWLALVPLAAGAVAWEGTRLDLAWQATGVGFLGGLAGGLIAGAIGLVTVPLIAVLLGLPIHVAAATNLFQTLFTAATGAASHAKHGHTDLRLGATVLAGAALGAPLGSWLSLRVSPDTLRLVFVVVLLAMAARLMLRIADVEPPKTQAQPGTAATVALGGAIGLVSGFLGIGGGFLFTPLIAMVLRVPTRVALGTGLLVIAGNSLLALGPHALAGNIWIAGGLCMAAGGSIGAKVGTRMSHWLPERGLWALFVVVLLAVAWRMAMG